MKNIRSCWIKVRCFVLGLRGMVATIKSWPGRVFRLLFRRKNIMLAVCYLIILLLARVDIASKDVVFRHLTTDELGNKVEGLRFSVSSFFDVVVVKNHGISFGLFNNLRYGHFILSAAVMSIVLVFFVYMHFCNSLPYRIGVALILSGAIGNLYDRMRLGYVRDFLDFHYDIYHFPAFNFADVFVFCGVCTIIIMDIVMSSKKGKK